MAESVTCRALKAGLKFQFIGPSFVHRSCLVVLSVTVQSNKSTVGRGASHRDQGHLVQVAGVGYKYSSSLLPPSPSFPGRSTQIRMRETAPSSTPSLGRAPGPSSSSMRSRGTSTPPSAWTASRKPSTLCGLRPGTDRRTSCWSPSQSSSSRCRTSTTASRASWRGPTSAAWRSCPPSVRVPWETCTSPLSNLEPAVPRKNHLQIPGIPELGSQKGKINKVA